jgi:hypothetical protein
MRFATNWPNGIRTFAFSMAIMLCLLTQFEVSAQQFIVQQPVGNDRDTVLYERFTQQLDLKRQAAESRIELCLADIDHACQLSDAQRKKLEIACKGAVNSHMTSATEQIKKSAKQVGFDFEPGNPPEKVDDDGEKNNNVVRAQNVFVMNGPGAIGQGEKAVEQEKIWKLSVKKVLTEEQDQKLQSWVSQRKRNTEKAAVNSFVARVDQQLLLSPNQRTKLTEWIDENYAQKLSEKSQVRVQGFVVLNRGQNDRSASIQGPVAAILTESQRDAWEKSFQKELDQLNQQVGGIRGVNAVPAIRMAPAWIKDDDDD